MPIILSAIVNPKLTLLKVQRVHDPLEKTARQINIRQLILNKMKKEVRS